MMTTGGVMQNSYVIEGKLKTVSVVYINSNQIDGIGADIPTAFFSNVHDADKLHQRLKDAGTIVGSVRTFDMFASFQQYEDKIRLDTIAQALNKLTPGERQALIDAGILKS